MNPDLLLVLLLLGAAILMFAVNRPPVDAVALIAMVVLPFTGVITANETISGFANPNIVLIGAMFVIGEALARTGVARRVGDWLATRGGDRPGRQLAILMLTVGLLGSVMSSTGVVAMFIPVVMRIASRARGAPSHLMMPMAYAALISGMLTLVATSPNLVINYELTLGLDQEADNGVFRIAQEALTNIARHANATKVEIDVFRSNGSAIIRIADNGRGFEPAALTNSRSLGLLGMRERARLMNGEISIESDRELGTVVELVVPAK